MVVCHDADGLLTWVDGRDFGSTTFALGNATRCALRRFRTLNSVSVRRRKTLFYERDVRIRLLSVYCCMRFSFREKINKNKNSTNTHVPGDARVS